MVLSKMAYREDVTEYSRLPWLLSGKEPVCQCRRHKFKALGQEDPLEEGIATHSSIFAWRIPMDRGAWQATVPRVTEESDITETT